MVIIIFKINHIIALCLLITVLSIAGCISDLYNISKAATIAKPQGQPLAVQLSNSSDQNIKQVTVNGSGSRTTQEFYLDKGLTTFQMDHEGYFTCGLQKNGSNTKLLNYPAFNTNEEGIAVSGDAGYYSLYIQADGQWNITISQPKPVTAAKPPLTLSGSGQKATQFFSIDNNVMWDLNITNDGSKSFEITILDSNGSSESFVMENVGNFKNHPSAVDIDTPGLYLFNVKSDGNWQIQITPTELG